MQDFMVIQLLVLLVQFHHPNLVIKPV